MVPTTRDDRARERDRPESTAPMIGRGGNGDDSAAGKLDRKGARGESQDSPVSDADWPPLISGEAGNKR